MGAVAVGGEILVNTATVQSQNTSQVVTLTGGGFAVIWVDTSAGVGGATGDGSGAALKAQVFDAAGAKVGTEVLVNVATAGTQGPAVITALANGGFAVAWADASGGVGGAGGDSFDRAIKARVFDASGVGGPEILANTTTAGDQSAPRIAGLGGGGFVVAWFDDSQTGGDTTGSAVRAQVFTATGQPVGGERLVNTATAGDQSAPQLAALSDGGFVLTWSDDSAGVGGAPGDGDAGAVKAQLFGADGSPLGGEVRINSTVTGTQEATNLLALPDGGFVAAFVDNSAGGQYVTRLRVFDADGAPLGSDFRAGDGAFAQVNVSLTALSGGRFVAVWRDGASNVDVAGRVFAADGSPVGAAFTAHGDDRPGTQDQGVVTALPDGGFVIVWREPQAGYNDGSNTAIKAQLFDADGAKVGVELLVNTATDGTQQDPHVAALAEGFVVTWSDPSAGVGGATGDDSAFAVKAQVFTLNTAPAVAGLAGSAAFVEGAGTPEAVAVAAAATVADADAWDAGGLASATVSITGGFHVGEDVLAFANATGMGDIAGTYDAATGVLTLTSAGGASPAEFQAALRAVTYLNTAQDPNAADRTLSFAVHDGTAPSAPVTRTLTVAASNDAPSGADAALALLEDGAKVLGAADFGFGDPDGDALQSVTITTLPAAGALTLDGAAVSAGAVVTAADLAAGKLVFTPAANANGAAYASFTFQVRDDGGVANGGQNTDPTANSLTFDVTPVSDAPSGTSATLTVGQDASRTLSVADFGFQDADGDHLVSVKIAAAPQHGALTLNGVAVTVNQVIAVADIAAGKLVFVPAPGQYGAGYDAFAFQLQDDGDVTQGGYNLDINPDTLTFDVTEAPPEPPKPTAPMVDGVPVTTTPGTSSDGTPTQTVTIPVVQPGRTDTVGGNNVADIPIVTAGGNTLLSVQAPAGYGLTASGPSTAQTAGASLSDLIREIKAHTSTGSADQTTLTGGGSGFLGGLTASTPLLVQTIVPTGGGAGAAPLVINGTAAAGDPMTALVIDTRSLPTGSALQLNNVAFAAIVGAVTVTGGAGSQTVYGDGASQNLFLGADDDELHGGGGTDTVASAGGADRLYGDEGADSVSGGVGDDLVHGNAGADTVSGGEGDDVAYGGKDNDRVNGDAGKDLIFGDLGDDVLQGNTGTDTLDGGAGADTVHGGQDNDQVNGGEGNDAVLGDAGDDAIQGGLGADTATGGIGGDLIHGGQGDDVIYGEAGNDWLSGDKGSDTLSGGAGADTFHANAQTGLDWVTDFNFAEGDRVLLDLGSTYAVSQGASGVVIDIAGGAQMVLAGVQLSTLGEGWIGLG